MVADDAVFKADGVIYTSDTQGGCALHTQLDCRLEGSISSATSAPHWADAEPACSAALAYAAFAPSSVSG
jgi:hypothetical protein